MLADTAGWIFVAEVAEHFLTAAAGCPQHLAAETLTTATAAEILVEAVCGFVPADVVTAVLPAGAEHATAGLYVAAETVADAANATAAVVENATAAAAQTPQHFVAGLS